MVRLSGPVRQGLEDRAAIQAANRQTNGSGTGPPSTRKGPPVSTINSGTRRVRHLSTIKQVALHLGCSERSIRNYISRGLFPAYRIPGTRGVRVDLAEVDAAMRLIPATVARPGFGGFGPNARIYDLPAQPMRAEVVDQ